MTAENIVINALGPAIPLRNAQCPPKRDGRNKPGHDRLGIQRRHVRYSITVIV